MLLSAQPIVEKIKKDLLKKFKKKPATLVIFLLTNDPASQKYVSLKEKMGHELGVNVIVERSLEKFDFYNQDSSTTGLMVQLPVPPDVHKDDLLASINPKKDVDGLNPKSGVKPATVLGILKLLEFYKVDLTDKNIVVLNDSSLIGRPLVRTLFRFTKNIAICNKFTRNLEQISSNADILISATGVSKLVNQSWLKQGSVVIDAGYPGDVDFESVKNRVSAITPVPGGVGPMTVISLFQNLLELANAK